MLTVGKGEYLIPCPVWRIFIYVNSQEILAFYNH